MLPVFWNRTLKPFSWIEDVEKEFDRLFSERLWPVGYDLTEGRSFIASNANTQMEETDTHYLLTVDIPGVSKKDINIELNNNQLMITASRVIKHHKGKEKSESTTQYRAFFTLPSEVDADKIEATYQDGVLCLAVPKTEAAKVKKIAVQEGKPSLFAKLVGGNKEKKEEK